MVGMRARLPLADRRRQLVDAALEVAIAEGIANTSVRRIAERAGVALGVVHYAFEDKDELIAALAERIVDELLTAAAEGLAVPETTDVSTTLRAALDGLWRTIEATPDEQLLTYEITTHALRTPGLRAAAERQYAVSHLAASALLQLAAQASGATWLDPIDELAAMALAMVDGVTLRWLVDRDAAGARRRLDAFADYLASRSVS